MEWGMDVDKICVLCSQMGNPMIIFSSSVPTLKIVRNRLLGKT